MSNLNISSIKNGSSPFRLEPLALGRTEYAYLVTVDSLLQQLAIEMDINQRKILSIIPF